MLPGGAMDYQAISFSEKLAKFNQHWSPRVVAEMNDYQFKLVKIEGDFVWHDHPDTDETFIVLSGEMMIAFHDGRVHLSAGEMFVVPKGLAHKPFAEKECSILVIEPRGVVNTGDNIGELTADGDVWV
jgi:mannose-6-phosphate isomerase-like protein (cupin superfamily)